MSTSTALSCSREAVDSLKLGCAGASQCRDGRAITGSLVRDRLHVCSGPAGHLEVCGNRERADYEWWVLGTVVGARLGPRGQGSLETTAH